MPDEITLPVLVDLLSRGSVTVLLAVAFWYIATNRFVTRERLDECHREREREIAEAAEARGRAEQRYKALDEDRRRIIADRDRLRRVLEDRRNPDR